MTQPGKQMRVGAREGSVYRSMKLVLLANGNRYEVDSNAFFFSKWQSPPKILEILPSPVALPTLSFFLHKFVVEGLKQFVQI
jgi:hypothetical protein